MYWVDIQLAQRKGFKFYQTRCNAIILYDTLPAYCIPKVVRLKNGEVLYEKANMSPRPPPKISLRHDWTKESGSKIDRQPEKEAARQPEGEVVRQTKFFQSTQPTPNPIRDRSGRPDDMKDGRNTSRSQEINVNSFNEELSSSVVMESGEIIYEKEYVSPRPPPTISFKDNWMKELDSEVAGSSKDTQRIQPKPKTQLSRTGRPV